MLKEVRIAKIEYSNKKNEKLDLLKDKGYADGKLTATYIPYFIDDIYRLNDYLNGTIKTTIKKYGYPLVSLEIYQAKVKIDGRLKRLNMTNLIKGLPTYYYLSNNLLKGSLAETILQKDNLIFSKKYDFSYILNFETTKEVIVDDNNLKIIKVTNDNPVNYKSNCRLGLKFDFDFNATIQGKDINYIVIDPNKIIDTYSYYGGDFIRYNAESINYYEPKLNISDLVNARGNGYHKKIEVPVDNNKNNINKLSNRLNIYNDELDNINLLKTLVNKDVDFTSDPKNGFDDTIRVSIEEEEPELK